MKHFMLDIETLGTRDYSAIIAIGAVYFDPNERGKIFERFYVTIDPEEAEKIGLRMNASTVTWWLHPKQRPAWDAWMQVAHFDPALACQGLQDWFQSIDQINPVRDPAHPERDRLVWGNGPDFDNRLMRQMFEVLKRDLPWDYRGDRCFRTMKSMPLADEVRPSDTGLHHNAIDDAIYQARWLQNIVYQRGLTL